MTLVLPLRIIPDNAIFWSRYSDNLRFDNCLWSVERELMRLGLPYLPTEPIIGKTVYEAQKEMGLRFLESGCEFILHTDADQELPQGSLTRMFETIQGGADIVTLHACRRHGERQRVEWAMWGQFDNHRGRRGQTTFFSPAVFFANRKVFVEINPNEWQSHYKHHSFGDAGTGENWFCGKILESPNLKHRALDLVSPHWELKTLKVRAQEDGKLETTIEPVKGTGHRGQHEFVSYPDERLYQNEL